MLAREVLRLRGTIPSREAEWDIMVDLYFYRDPEAEEQKALEDSAEKVVPGADDVPVETGFAAATVAADWQTTDTAGFGAPEATGGTATWDADAGPADWAAEPTTEAPTVTAGW